MELKDIIYNRRKALGLTLDEIAHHVGVGTSTVSKWERGEITNVKRTNIAALADVLKVSPLVLMGREEPSGGQIDAEIAKMIKQLSPSDVEALRAILRAMTNK